MHYKTIFLLFHCHWRNSPSENHKAIDVHRSQRGLVVNCTLIYSMQTLCTFPALLFLFFFFSFKNFYYYISRQEAKEYTYFQVNSQALNTKYTKNRHGQASKDRCCRRKAWSCQVTLRLVGTSVHSGTQLWDSTLSV